MPRTPYLLIALMALAMLPGTALPAQEIPTWELPIATHRLDNGLQVVVSRDDNVPAIGIAVVYGVGFRLEPRGRTGFAHLFEHLMFQGTEKVPKGLYSTLVQSSGGVQNGSTRFDFTDYYASLPVAALERILWLEADRMRGLDLTEESLANQKEVVKEEIRRSVQNRPHGGLFWGKPPALAFERWENAHDGYGSFADLEAATLDEARAFQRTYYAPNNAVVAIAGAVEPERAFALVEKYFGDIPAQELPPPPELGERLSPGEKWLERVDDFASTPALFVSWRAPEPRTRDYYATILLTEILAGSEASRLHRALVREGAMAERVSGRLHWLDGPYAANGPALSTLYIPYRKELEGRAVVARIDETAAEIAREGVGSEELERALTQELAGFYGDLEPLGDRARTLGRLQLFTGDAAVINRIPAHLAEITPDDLRRVAGRYLVPANRVVIDSRPRTEEESGEGKEEAAP